MVHSSSQGSLALVTAAMLFLACSSTNTYQLHVSGQTLRNAAPALRVDGKATVDATRDLDTEFVEPVEIRMEQYLKHGDKRSRVVDLLGACGLLPPDKVCSLDNDSQYLVRSVEEHYMTTSGYIWTGVWGGVVGMGACTYGCTSASATRASKAGLIAVGIGVLVAAIVNCMGHWGEPGCRD